VYRKIEDDKFIILFSDNGIGISEADKHRVLISILQEQQNKEERELDYIL
jgi:DNA topoisomerase VI subunit B